MITAPLPTLPGNSSNELLAEHKTRPPLIAVAGSHGKSTVSWLVSQMAQHAGANVGSWLSNGVFINIEQQPGELGAWKRVLLAGRAGEIDLAIQEMNSATVLGVGLPPDTYQIALLNNICGNDAHCQTTEAARREVEAGRTILGSLAGAGIQIGNADDQSVVTLLDESERTTILFALHIDNPVLASHLAAGGTAAWVADDTVVFGSKSNAADLVRIDDLPASVGGSLTFQVQNILAAICASAAIGLPISAATEVARKFTPDVLTLPGACNIFQYFGARIIVDAANSPWPLKKLVRGMRKQPHRRTVVSTGCFPEMTHDDVREAARVIGSLAGIVVLHGEKQHPERFRLMKHGLADNPVPPILILVDDEAAAVDRLLNAMKQQDVGLVLAEDRRLVIDHLHPAPNVSI